MNATADIQADHITAGPRSVVMIKNSYSA